MTAVLKRRWRGKANGPVSVMVPLGGFSAFDRKGGPFHDPEGVRVFVDSIKTSLRPGTSFYPLPYHINDPEFAEAIVETLEGLVGRGA